MSQWNPSTSERELAQNVAPETGYQLLRLNAMGGGNLLPFAGTSAVDRGNQSFQCTSIRILGSRAFKVQDPSVSDRIWCSTGGNCFIPSQAKPMMPTDRISCKSGFSGIFFRLAGFPDPESVPQFNNGSGGIDVVIELSSGIDIEPGTQSNPSAASSIVALVQPQDVIDHGTVAVDDVGTVVIAANSLRLFTTIVNNDKANATAFYVCLTTPGHSGDVVDVAGGDLVLPGGCWSNTYTGEITVIAASGITGLASIKEYTP